MYVVKFGGSSVGSAERMKIVASIINNDKPKLVVVSAIMGTVYISLSFFFILLIFF
jgi:aspartate kinase